MVYVPAMTSVGASGFAAGDTVDSPDPPADSTPPDSSMVVGLPLLQRKMWPAIVCFGSAQSREERLTDPVSAVL